MSESPQELPDVWSRQEARSLGNVPLQQQNITRESDCSNSEENSSRMPRSHLASSGCVKVLWLY